MLYIPILVLIFCIILGLIFCPFLNQILASSSMTLENPRTLSTLKNTKNVVMCYFGSWSTRRYGDGFFDVEDIDPFLCTHLVFAFAGLDPSTNEIKVLDTYNELDHGHPDWGRGAYRRFTALKAINTKLLTLLAIGGWNEG